MATSPDPQTNPHQAVARWTLAVAVFTFFLVVVSGVADWFIYQQYRVANDAQRDTREQLRAVVTYSGLDIGIVKATDNKIHYNVGAIFRNTGGTRTNNFIAWLSAHLFDKDVPYSQDFSRPWAQVKATNFIVGAGANAISGPISIPEEDALAVRDSKGKLIVWGYAEWSDIFDKDITHIINYCEVLEAAGSDVVVTIVPQPPPGVDIVALRASPFRPECNNSK